MWIERKLSNKILEAARTRPALILTGIRQAGKSSLLRRLFPDADFVSFDIIEFADEAQSNPSRFLDQFKHQVILDEIQYVPSLFRELKIRIDKDRDVNGRWILTGSQQFGLMRGISDSLAGRIRIMNLGSLNISELSETDLLDERREFLWKGGFPEIWAEKLNITDFYQDYIQSYLERDLKQLLNVSKLRDFRRFLSALAIRAGQLVNYSEVASDIEVTANTVKAWVSILEVSGMITLLPPYYRNLGTRLIKAPKLYFCDNGLIAYLLTIGSTEDLNNSPYLGNLWENFVFTEFQKEGMIAGRNLFYLRDQNGFEIDFVLEKGGRTYLVEAKHEERPDQQKLNFNKFNHRFATNVLSILACGLDSDRKISFKDYSAYNPLRGYNIFD